MTNKRAIKRPNKEDYTVHIGQSSLVKWGEYVQALEEYAIALQVSHESRNSLQCVFYGNNDVVCEGYCDECVLKNWSSVPQEIKDEYKFN